MSVTTEAVLNALKAIIDPDLRRDIVSLNFIKDLHIDNGVVSFKVELTTPACPVKEQMRRQALDAVMGLPNVRGVNIEMTSRVQSSRKKGGESLIPDVKNVIAVASGKGGVGKSTTAVNLALALSQAGARTGILDADIYGPSLPKMLRVEKPPQHVEGRKIPPAEAFGLKVMSMGFFMDPDTPVVWRGPMVGMAVEQLLRDVDWGELDYLVIDLPPGTGDAQLTLTQKVPITGVVIVSTPQDVALADVTRGINMFRKVDAPVLGIIENMSYFLCPSCGHRAEIFSHGGARKQAETFGLEFLGDIPLDGTIRQDADSGIPILVAHPDSPQTQKYREIAARIAAIIATMGFSSQGFPEIIIE
ncbi:MAG: iron-sulfur cluster carrier protein ApbC [Magnetococcales bacterium]|nr:iron-sulfur cluster carrier protein ApbC [Magnetococcales bacterium]